MFSAVKFHRFQGYMKFGEDMFKKGMVIRHLNNIKLDNSWYNIAIGTYSQNVADSPVEVYSHPKHSHQNIIEDHKKGMSYNAIMKKYNISSKGTVSFIINKSISNDS